MVRVGLVGCGTIGSRVARALNRKYAKTARITALHDSNPAHARSLQRRLTPRPAVLPLDSLIRRCDLIIEAASSSIAGPLVVRALRANRDILVMSVGGLLRGNWKRHAHRSRGRVLIPSGALAGLDGVKALAVGRLRRASLTTRKPPRALADAPYVRRHGLRLERLTRARVIFEGTPRAAVRAFPQNTNVAAALALASGSSARARIRVIADPAIARNIHELDVEGDCGRIRCRIESRPSGNPKTSELAVRSAVAALDRLFGAVAIGT
jgi:aspartate dehydrogenase